MTAFKTWSYGETPVASADLNNNFNSTMANNNSILSTLNSNNNFSTAVEGGRPINISRNIYRSSLDTNNSTNSTNFIYATRHNHNELVCNTAGAYVYESEVIPLDSNATQIFGFIDYNVYTLLDECVGSTLSSTNFQTITNMSGSTNAFAYTTTPSSNCTLRTKNFTTNNNFHMNYSIHSISSEYVDYKDTECLLYVDWTNKKVYLNKSTRNSTYSGIHPNVYFTNTATVFSLATLATTNYSIQFRGLGGGQTCYVEITDGTTAITLDSNSTGGANNTKSQIWLNGIRILKTSSISTTATVSVSADNGSHYTAVTNGTDGVVTAGSLMKIKLAGTLAANEVLIIRGMGMSKTL